MSSSSLLFTQSDFHNRKRPGLITMTDHDEDLPSFELLLSSIFYLITQYSLSKDDRLPMAIVQHIQLLLSHPDCKEGILTRNLYALLDQWEHISMIINNNNCIRKLSSKIKSPPATANVITIH